MSFRFGLTSKNRLKLNMSRIRCKKCDLINFATDTSCKRCGAEMNPKKSSSSKLSLDFSGIRRILFYLIIVVIGYFAYQKFVEQTYELKQQVDSQSSFKKEPPKPPPGYQNLIKNEIKKLPSPSPQ
jgi:hypothetical protein